MKYAYYPGCSLHATAIEYNLSVQAVARHLGIELQEIPEWSCCGASAAHTTDHLLGLGLAARNLALAEKQGLDVAIPCAACFNRLKAAEAAAQESEAMRAKLADLTGMDFRGTSRARAFLDILVSDVGLQAIETLATKPLKGLKVACYYGCLLVRPPKLTRFDDPENPQSMDRLMAALGAAPVPFAYKNECCSASLALPRTDMGLKMVYEIFLNAKEMGADCVVTACPLCMANLDMRQKGAAAKYQAQLDLPVFYFTELMGLSFGYSPKDLGVPRHFTDGMKLLAAKELAGAPARREQA